MKTRLSHHRESPRARLSAYADLLSDRSWIVCRRCSVEALEDRRMLAAVQWDGGGDGVRWHDAANWSNDRLPTIEDDVTIDTPGNATIVVSGDNALTRTLVVRESLQLDNANIVSTSIALLDGTLSGSGQITGNLVNTSGVLAPGEDGSGTMSIEGALTLEPDGTLQVNLNGPTPEETDRIDVSGRVSVAGTISVVLSSDFEPDPQATFTVLRGGVISGHVADAISNTAEFEFSGIVDGAELKVAPIAIPFAEQLRLETNAGLLAARDTAQPIAAAFGQLQGDVPTLDVPRGQEDVLGVLQGLRDNFQRNLRAISQATTSLEELTDQLQSHGFSVDCVVGQAGCAVSRSTNGDLLRFHVESDAIEVFSSGHSANFTATPIESLLGPSPPSAEYDLTGELSVQWHFAIDSGGFYVSPQTRLQADLGFDLQTSTAAGLFDLGIGGSLTLSPIIEFSSLDLDSDGRVRSPELSSPPAVQIGDVEASLSVAAELPMLDYVDVDGISANNSIHGGDVFRFAGTASGTTADAGFVWTEIDLHNPDVDQDGILDFTSEVLVDNLRAAAHDLVRAPASQLHISVLAAANEGTFPLSNASFASALSIGTGLAETLLRRTEVVEVVQFDTVERWINEGLPDMAEEIIRVNVILDDQPLIPAENLNFDLTTVLPSTETTTATVQLDTPVLRGNLVFGLDTSSKPLYLLVRGDSIRPDAVSRLGIDVGLLLDIDGEPLGAGLLALQNAQARLDTGIRIGFATSGDGKLRLGDSTPPLAFDAALAPNSSFQITADRAQLFPNRAGEGFQGRADLLRGNLDLNTGAFEITAERVGLDFGTAASASANQVLFAFDPTEMNQQTVAELDNVQFKFPSLEVFPDAGLDSASLLFDATSSTFTLDLSGIQVSTSDSSPEISNALAREEITFETHDYKYEVVDKSSSTEGVGVSINNEGLVAFPRTDDSGSGLVVQQAGGNARTISVTDGTQFGSTVSLNNASPAQLAVLAANPNGVQEIRRYRTDAVNSFSIEASSSENLVLKDGASLSDGGEVAYRAARISENQLEHIVAIAELGDDDTVVTARNVFPLITSADGDRLLLKQEEELHFYRDGAFLDDDLVRGVQVNESGLSLGNRSGATSDGNAVAYIGEFHPNLEPSRGGFGPVLRFSKRVVQDSNIAGDEEFFSIEAPVLFANQFDGIQSFDADAPVTITADARENFYHISFVAYDADGKRGLYTLAVVDDDRGDITTTPPQLVVHEGGTLSGLEGTVKRIDVFEPLNAKGDVAFHAVMQSDAEYSVVVRATAQLRPIFIVPKYGASGPRNDVEGYLTKRGAAPSDLGFNAALAEPYRDLIQTLKNVGYVENENLFVIHYDPRVPVAPDDLIDDGLLQDVSEEALTDGQFDTQLDYVATALRNAKQQLGTAFDRTAVIADREGGNVIRAYVQAQAAIAAAGVAGGLAAAGSLPQIGALVTIGMPAAGIGDAFLTLADQTASTTDSAKNVLRQLTEQAYKLVEEQQKTIFAPDQEITQETIEENGQSSVERFQEQNNEGLQSQQSQNPQIIDIFSERSWFQLDGPLGKQSALLQSPTFQWSLVEDVEVDHFNLFVSVFPHNRGLLPTTTPRQGEETTVTAGTSAVGDVNPGRIVTKLNLPGNTTQFTIPDGVRLTASQQYYWSVEAVPIASSDRDIAIVQGTFETAAVRSQQAGTFSAVTILTHGFQIPYLEANPSTTKDLIEMAHMIAGTNNGLVLRYRPRDGAWLVQPSDPDADPAKMKVARLPEIRALKDVTGGRPLVILPDWGRDSGIGDVGFSEAAADAFFAALVELNHDVGGALMQSPLHFIGFSRGTVVTSEMIQRLGVYFPDVGRDKTDLHVTLLDPHDFDQPSLNTNLIPLVAQANTVTQAFGINIAAPAALVAALTGITEIPFDDFNEPEIKFWDNISYAENYWQAVGNVPRGSEPGSGEFPIGFTPNGRPIAELEGGQRWTQTIVNEVANGSRQVTPQADVDRSLVGLAGFQHDAAIASDSAARTPAENIAGLGTTHLRVKSWYTGTIDVNQVNLPADAFASGPVWRGETAQLRSAYSLEDNDPVPAWYDTPGIDDARIHEGIGAGWAASVLGGRIRVDNPDHAPRTSVFVDNTPNNIRHDDRPVPSVFNGSFDITLTPTYGRFPIPTNVTGALLQADTQAFFSGIVASLSSIFGVPKSLAAGLAEILEGSGLIQPNESVAESIRRVLPGLPASLRQQAPELGQQLDELGDTTWGFITNFGNPSWREVPGWSFHGGTGGFTQGNHLVSVFDVSDKEAVKALFQQEGLPLDPLARAFDDAVNEVAPNYISIPNILLENVGLSLGSALQGFTLAVTDAIENGLIDHAFRLSPDAPAIEHNRLFVPSYASELTVDLRAIEQADQGDVLRIYLYDPDNHRPEPLEEIPLIQLMDDFRTFRFDVPSDLVGATAQIKLEIEHDGDGDSAAVLVDNVFFSAISTTDTSGDANDNLVFFLDTADTPLPPAVIPPLENVTIDESEAFELDLVSNPQNALIQPASTGERGVIMEADQGEASFGSVHTIAYTNNHLTPVDIEFTLSSNEFIRRAIIPTPTGTQVVDIRYSPTEITNVIRQDALPAGETFGFVLDAELRPDYFTDNPFHEIPILATSLTATISPSQGNVIELREDEEVTYDLLFLADRADDDPDDNVLKFADTVVGKRRELTVQNDAGVLVGIPQNENASGRFSFDFPLRSLSYEARSFDTSIPFLESGPLQLHFENQTFEGPVLRAASAPKMRINVPLDQIAEEVSWLMNNFPSWDPDGRAAGLYDDVDRALAQGGNSRLMAGIREAVNEIYAPFSDVVEIDFEPRQSNTITKQMPAPREERVHVVEMREPYGRVENMLIISNVDGNRRGGSAQLGFAWDTFQQLFTERLRTSSQINTESLPVRSLNESLTLAQRRFILATVMNAYRPDTISSPNRDIPHIKLFLNDAVRKYTSSLDGRANHALFLDPVTGGLRDGGLIAFNFGLHLGSVIAHEIGHTFGLIDEYLGQTIQPRVTPDATYNEPTPPIASRIRENRGNLYRGGRPRINELSIQQTSLLGIAFHDSDRDVSLSGVDELIRYQELLDRIGYQQKFFREGKSRKEFTFVTAASPPAASPAATSEQPVSIGPVSTAQAGEIANALAVTTQGPNSPGDDVQFANPFLDDLNFESESTELSTLDSVVHIFSTSQPTTSEFVGRVGPQGDAQFYSIESGGFRHPEEDEAWFQPVVLPQYGDGVTPLDSLATPFFRNTAVQSVNVLPGQRADEEGVVFTNGSLGSDNLIANPDVQRRILKSLGIDAPDSVIVSTASDINADRTLLFYQNSAEGFLVDPQGRRLGFSVATGVVNEIPNSAYTGDTTGFGHIHGAVPGNYRFELIGTGERFTVGASVDGIHLTGGFHLSDMLADNVQRSETFEIKQRHEGPGFPSLFELRAPTLNADLVLTVGPEQFDVSGSISVAAAGAALFPDTETEDLDGVVTASAVEGSIDFDSSSPNFGALTLSANTAGIDFGDIRVSVGTESVDDEPGLTLQFDRGETGSNARFATLRNLQVVNENPDGGVPADPVVLVDEVAVRRNGFDVSLSAAASVTTLGDPAAPLLELTDSQATFDLSISVAPQVDVRLATNFAADTATILPGQAFTASIVGDGLENPGIQGSLDFNTGDVEVALHQLDADLLGFIQVDVPPRRGGTPAAQLHFDPNAVFDPNGPPDQIPVVARFGALNGSIPSLNPADPPSATIDGLGIRQDGSAFLSSVSVDPNATGTLQAGVLPVTLDSVAIQFPDPNEVGSAVVTASGRFEMAEIQNGLRGLLGDDDVTVTASVGNGDVLNGSFDVALAIDRVDGVRPLELGPIDVGIENLDVQNLTLNGRLTLAGFQNGNLLGGVSGRFEVVADSETAAGNDGFSGLEILIQPSSQIVTSVEPDGTVVTRLEVDAVANLAEAAVSGTLGGVQVSGGALGLAFSIETATAPGGSLELRQSNLELTSLQISEATIEIGDFIHMTLRDVSAVSNPQPGAPNFQVGTADIFSPMLPELTGQATNIAIFDDPGVANDRTLAFGTTTVEMTGSVGSLDGLLLDLTDFEFNLDTNQFNADAIRLRVIGEGGFADAIGLAGILPFDVTEIGATFENNSTRLQATGFFEEPPIEAPTGPDGDSTFFIHVGEPSAAGDNLGRFDFDARREFSFAFQLANNGTEIRPLQIPQLTLGFDRLDLGVAQLDGFLSLGTYDEAGNLNVAFGGGLGVRTDLGFTGTAVLEGTFAPESGEIDALAEVAFTYALPDTVQGLEVEIQDASARFSLGLRVEEGFSFVFDELTLNEGQIESLSLGFVDDDENPLVALAASGVSFDLTPDDDPTTDDHLLSFASVEGTLGMFAAPVQGSIRNFAIDHNLRPVALEDFGFALDGELSAQDLGFPDVLPITIRQLDVELGAGFLEGSDYSQIVLTASGGLEKTEIIPASAEVEGLRIDVAELVRGDMLDALQIEGFQVDMDLDFGAFQIDAALGLQTINYPDPLSGPNRSLVADLNGGFTLPGGIGGSARIFITEVGPLAASLTAQLGLTGIPLGTTGISINRLGGQIIFAAPELNVPADPRELLERSGSADTLNLKDITEGLTFDQMVEITRQKFSAPGGPTPVSFDDAFVVAINVGLGLTGVSSDVFDADVTLGARVNPAAPAPDLTMFGLGTASLSSNNLGEVGMLLDLPDPTTSDTVFQIAFKTPGEGDLGDKIPGEVSLAADFRVVEDNGDTRFTVKLFGTVEALCEGLDDARTCAFQADADGTVEISDAGLVGGLELVVDGGIDLPGVDVDLDGEFQLLVNLTDASDDLAGSLGLNVIELGACPGTDCRQLEIPNQTVKVFIDGQLAAGGFVVDGTFLIESSPAGLLVAADGTIELGDFGSLGARGALLLEDDGAAGSLEILAELGIPGIVEFDGAALFQFSTLSEPVRVELPNEEGTTIVVDAPRPEELPGGYFRVRVAGTDSESPATLRLFPSENRIFGIDATALFDLRTSGDLMMLEFDAGVQVIAANFNVADGELGGELTVQGDRIFGRVEGQVNLFGLELAASAELNEFGCLSIFDGQNALITEFGNCGLIVSVPSQEIQRTDTQVRVELTEPAERDLDVRLRVTAAGRSPRFESVRVRKGRSAGILDLADVGLAGQLGSENGNVASFQLDVRSAEYVPEGDFDFFVPPDPEIDTAFATVTVFDAPIFIDVQLVNPNATAGLTRLDQIATLLSGRGVVDLSESADDPLEVRFSARGLGADETVTLDIDPRRLPGRFGFATEGLDFTISRRTVTLGAGQTETVVINPIDDDVFELNERVSIDVDVVSSPSIQTRVLTSRLDFTILNDDAERPEDAIAFYSFDRSTVVELPVVDLGGVELRAVGICCTETASASFSDPSVDASQFMVGHLDSVQPLDVHGPGLPKLAPEPALVPVSPAAVNARWGPQPTDYYEFTIDLTKPAPRTQQLKLRGLDFWHRLQRLPNTTLEDGPRSWQLRSSRDGFDAILAEGDIRTASRPTHERTVFDEELVIGDSDAAVTFRLFAVSSPNRNGNLPWILDNVAVIGLANNPPVAQDDLVQLRESESIAERSITIRALDNDVDADGEALMIRSFTQPAGFCQTQRCVQRVGNDFVYTPHGQVGTETFRYTVVDPHGDLSVAEVTIDVLDEPNAFGDQFQLPQDGRLDVSAANGMLANDHPGDGGPLRVTSISTPPQRGQLTFESNGSFIYIPNRGFAGSDGFSYTAENSVGTTRGQVTLFVREPTVPRVLNDTFNGTEDVVLSVRAPGVLSNDIVDPFGFGEQGTVSLVKGPAGLDLNDDGSFRFVPPRNANGAFTFTYLANNSAGASSVATARIHLRAVNDRPTAFDPTPIRVASGSTSPITINLTGRDIETPLSQLTFRISRNPSFGRLTLSGRTATYTPSRGGVTKADSFEFQVVDRGDPSGLLRGGSSSAPARVSIEPIAVKTSLTTNRSFSFSGSVFNGYVEGATIFIDANRNGVLDYLDLNGNGIQDLNEPTEPSDITAADGSYEFFVPSEFDQNGNGRIGIDDGLLIAVGGVVNATQLPLDAPLLAWPNASTVTPMSSLLAWLVDNRDFSLASAETHLEQSYQLGNIGLRRFDPNEAASGGDLRAPQAELANVLTQNSLVLLRAMLSGAGANTERANAIALDALGGLISSAGDSSILGQIAPAENLIVNALARVGVILPTNQSQVAAAVLTTVHDSAVDIEPSADEPYLEALARLERIVQTDLAQLLQAMVGGERSVADVVAFFRELLLDERARAATIGNVIAPGIFVDDVSVFEGDSGQRVAEVTVQLSRPSTVPIQVHYATVTGSATAGDFRSDQGVVSFAVGETDQIVSIEVAADTQIEVNEVFYLELAEPSGAIIVDQRGTITIKSDDLPGDANTDGRVDFTDFQRLAAHFGQTNASWRDGDFDGDDVVDFDDVVTLLNHFGEIRIEPDIGDANLDGAVRFDDFAILGRNFRKQDAVWTEGDFDGNEIVDFTDFVLLVENFLSPERARSRFLDLVLADWVPNS